MPVVSEISERDHQSLQASGVQRMLGYGMLGPMGSVDGRDPIRLLRDTGLST